MCGIIGLAARQNSLELTSELCRGLCVLQHRGQDAAGISWMQENEIVSKKGIGLVRDVFKDYRQDDIARFGIGHVRYPTSGSYSSDLAQPFSLRRSKTFDISLAHNGNLVNTEELTQNLIKRNINLTTNSDSEVLLNVLAQYLDSKISSADQIFSAIEKLHKDCIGAYAVVTLIAGVGMLAFRDPHGIRPLVMGVKEDGMGKQYAFASESSALSLLGFQIERSVQAGEAIFIDMQGNMHSRICADDTQLTPCIFEHVYLARPDSTLDDIHVYRARLRQGQHLAQNIMRTHHYQDIDVIIPIPDTSRVSAQAAAEVMGIKLREGLIKNRYIGRTFIMPNQQERQHAVRNKLSIIHSEVQNKKVLLIDDSIVRGTTSREIVRMIREAGAKEVYLASAAPEIKYPNIYGIDMPCQKDFIADQCNVGQIAKKIDASWVCYQKVEDLIAASQTGNPQIKQFECSVFTGEYITGQPSAEYLEQLSQDRGNKDKKAHG